MSNIKKNIPPQSIETYQKQHTTNNTNTTQTFGNAMKTNTNEHITETYGDTTKNDTNITKASHRKE